MSADAPVNDPARPARAAEPGAPCPGARLSAPIVGRSVIVGAGATLLDLGALAVLVSCWAMDVRVASPVALAFGLVAQFVGNKSFAFRDRSGRWVAQGVAFGAVEAAAFVLNLLAFHAAISFTSLPYLAARLLTTSLVYFSVCLPAWSLIFVPNRSLEGENAR